MLHSWDSCGTLAGTAVARWLRHGSLSHALMSQICDERFLVVHGYDREPGS